MRRIWAGLAVCALAAGVASGAYSSADVQAGIAPAGSAVEGPAGTWTIKGAGEDIWGQTDGMHYLWNTVPVSGDFAVSCRVVSFGGTSSTWGKAGIMARVPSVLGDPLFDGTEAYASSSVTTGNGRCIQWRDAAPGTPADANWPGTAATGGPNNTYVKLVRQVDTFFAFHSPQPPLWIPSGPVNSYTFTNLAGADMYVGFAVSAHNSDVDPDALATAVVDSFNFADTPVSTTGPSALTCTINGANVDLAWTNNDTYAEIQVWRQDLGGSFTRVTPGPANNATSFSYAPGDGLWTFWVAGILAGNQACVPVSCTATLGNAGFIDLNGFFRSWLLFGPVHDDAPCATPLADAIADYITDGSTTEDNMLPSEGDVYTPTFGANGNPGTMVLGPFTATSFPGNPTVNPNAPTDGEWYLWHDGDDGIDLSVVYTPLDETLTNTCVGYAVCYLVNSKPTTQALIGGTASDDSVVAKLDNVYLWAPEVGMCRGWGNANTVEEQFPVLLPPGEHRLLVKTFEEGGGFGFRFQLLKLDGTPVSAADGISIKTLPTMATVPAAPTPQSNFTCTAAGLNINLSWTNGQAYSQIFLFRRNSAGVVTQIAVGNTATSVTDTVPAGGDYMYFIGAVTAGNAATQVQTCSLNVGNVGTIDAAGYFRTWLLFGPINDSAVCATPYAALVADYYTDGAETEQNMLPVAGDVHSPDFGLTPAGTTAVLGPLAGGVFGTANPNAPAEGEWYRYDSADGLINLNDTVYLNDPNLCMSYAVIYLRNLQANARLLIGACNSDDSIAVALNNSYFWAPSPAGACRGDTGVPVDRFPLLLPPGESRLMVKTFEEGGGFNFRFRLENPDGTVLTSADGIEISYVPTMTTVPPAPTATATRRMPSVMITGFEATVSIDVAVLALDVIESVPSSMTIGAVSNGGVKNGQQINWTNIPAGTTITYKVTPSAASGKFQGVAKESVSGAWLVIGGATIPVVPMSLVDGWFSADIADSGLAGTASVTKTGDTYSMSARGSGHDIWDTADDFRFVWKSFPADKSLVMQCQLQTILGGTNTWSKYGLMFRTFPTQGSPAVYAVYSRDGQGDTIPDPSFQWRDASDGAANHDAAWFGLNLNHELPAWLRMVYKNGIVTAYWSDDDGGDAPVGWYGGLSHVLNLEGQTTFLAGVCVTSHDDAQSTTGSFKFVEVVSLCEPVTVTRSFSGAGQTNLEGVPAAIYEDGTDLTVSLALANPRVAGECPALGQVIITETVPAGFAVSGISNGGTESGGIITWTFAAGTLPAGPLTYTINGTLAANAAMFAGEVTENPLPNEFGPFATGGGNALVSANGLGIDPGIEGSVLSWLLLGPYAQSYMPAEAPPILPEDLRKDFLTDGTSITEEDVMPEAGDTVDTDYVPGAAASDALVTVANPAINPGGVPTWFAWRDKDQMVDLGGTGGPAPVFTEDVNYAMMYAVAYLCVDEAMTITLAAGSDDALQVLVDGTEAIMSPVYRGWGGLQDVSGPITLEPGVHRLMVKVFECGGGFDFGVQLRAEDGLTPLMSGIGVTLDPNGCGGTPPAQIYVKMGAVNAGPGVDIADAIALLGYLFAQKAAPLCAKAADANDDDALNIADAITILGYLFSSKPMFAPDHSEIKAANNTCKGYAADGNDGKPFFPAKIGALNACDTQCTP